MFIVNDPLCFNDYGFLKEVTDILKIELAAIYDYGQIDIVSKQDRVIVS